MKITSRIENIFCKIDLKQNLDITDRMAEEAGLEPSGKISSYIYTHPKLNVKTIVLSSGEVHINGAKSHEDIESAFWGLKNKLKKAGIPISITPDIDYEIENVLATGNIHDYLPGLEIDLERISLNENAVYAPDKFPAVFLTFLVSKCRGTAMVFKSGKVLIGDVKSHEDANIILAKVLDIVR